MKKMKLDLEQIRVDSFDTTSPPAERRGTVKGAEMEACCCCCCCPCCCTVGESCGGTCDATVCGASCPASCNGTCPGQFSCGGQWTCGQYTCGGYSCDYPCGQSYDYYICESGGPKICPLYPLPY